MPDLQNVDLSWQPEPLQEDWPRGADTEFIMWRMEQAFIDQAKDGPGGLLLDIACGHARHCMELRAHGWDFIGIEPSPEMVRRAREWTAAAGDPAEMMYGIGELLPFKDESFDRILCMSSLDHFANPDVGMREMARILKPDGRIVIGLVNYAGIACNGSRLLYKLGRRIGTIPKGKRMFWDDPTEGEHTFEGKTKALKKFAEGSLVLEKEYGASMMWAFPGWKYVFYPFMGRSKPMRVVRGGILKTADRIGRAFPTVSDFVVTTWRKP
ncbi:MAG: class I SAM-dependent methyltransferase [Chloroflexi bacterium]|nr:class I SAM-dependent methyltransferase [Chloroflexota bacterium]